MELISFPKVCSHNMVSYLLAMYPMNAQMVTINLCALALYFSEYRSVVATCVLYYMISDVRIKQDHTRIITIVEVGSMLRISPFL